MLCDCIRRYRNRRKIIYAVRSPSSRYLEEEVMSRREHEAASNVRARNTTMFHFLIRCLLFGFVHFVKFIKLNTYGCVLCIHIILFINHLLLPDNCPQTYQPKTTNRSYSFCGSGIQSQLR